MEVSLLLEIVPLILTFREKEKVKINRKIIVLLLIDNF
jgi:hypothetical protein